MARGPLVLLLWISACLFLFFRASCFYLPGVAPQDFHKVGWVRISFWFDYGFVWSSFLFVRLRLSFLGSQILHSRVIFGRYMIFLVLGWLRNWEFRFLLGFLISVIDFSPCNAFCCENQPNLLDLLNSKWSVGEYQIWNKSEIINSLCTLLRWISVPCRRYLLGNENSWHFHGSLLNGIEMQLKCLFICFFTGAGRSSEGQS